MEGQNRRLERNKGVLRVLEERFAINTTIDLSPLEQHSMFLEGTGSMVLDREHRISYACHSGELTPKRCASSPNNLITASACSMPSTGTTRRSTTAT